MYRARFDAPEVLINNAGYTIYETFGIPLEEIRRLFDVNLTGAALVTREFLPDMIPSRWRGHRHDRIDRRPCSDKAPVWRLLGVEAWHGGAGGVAAGRDGTFQRACAGGVSWSRRHQFFLLATFRRRARRPESTRTVQIGKRIISRSIVRAIARNRFLTYVPGYYALIPWLAAALPIVFRPIWHRLLTSRVESVYTRSSATESPVRSTDGSAPDRPGA